MRKLTIGLAILVLAGCASVPAPDRRELYDDALFKPPSQRIDAADVFAVSPAMKQFIATDIPYPDNAHGARKALVDALYKKGQLELDYDGTLTRNASEAFAARSGNCLSLVIMTAAFAKALDLPVRFQHAFVDETWSRQGNVYLSIGHVNLTLGPTRMDGVYGRNGTDLMMIDFLPPEDLRGMRTRVIEEKTIVAMYMNNRAVESLSLQDLDDAYWWAREAMRQDPYFLSAFNTLGVVFWRHGNLERAQRAFAYVLDREPANPNAMSNLAEVLGEMGRVAEARELKDRLARLEPDPPFAFFNRGVTAMAQGDYRIARDYFEKEVDRAAYYHEFHFWLALAEIRLGDYEHAREHLKIAVETSTTRSDHDLYASKLDHIRSYLHDSMSPLLPGQTRTY